MPGTLFPDHHHDSVNTTRSTYLELPPQSADRVTSPYRQRSPRSTLSPSPKPGQRCHRKRAKNVHWDTSVVDNERKMQSRTKKSEAAVRPSKAQDASAKEAEHASSSKSPTAKTSVKMDSSHSRQSSDYNFMQSRRPSSPVCSEHSRASGHHTPVANSSSKMDSFPKKKSPTKFRKPPPAVPDPPRAHRPPPAPRPARLPTPDLPEIDEEIFFIPKHKLFDFSRGRSEHRERPVYQKQDDQRR